MFFFVFKLIFLILILNQNLILSANEPNLSKEKLKAKQQLFRSLDEMGNFLRKNYEIFDESDIEDDDDVDELDPKEIEDIFELMDGIKIEDDFELFDETEIKKGDQQGVELSEIKNLLAKRGIDLMSNEFIEKFIAKFFKGSKPLRAISKNGKKCLVFPNLRKKNSELDGSNKLKRKAVDLPGNSEEVIKKLKEDEEQRFKEKLLQVLSPKRASVYKELSEMKSFFKKEFEVSDETDIDRQAVELSEIQILFSENGFGNLDPSYIKNFPSKCFKGVKPLTPILKNEKEVLVYPNLKKKKNKDFLSY